MIGETQSGKSTFITLAYRINNLDIPNTLKTGHSLLSVTADATPYGVVHQGQTYQFGADQGTPRPSNRVEWIKQLCSLPPPTLSAPSTPLQLNLLDTPGLNDSTLTGGKDEDHIASVLQALQTKSFASLNSVIFVVKYGTALTGSFQHMFLLYKRILQSVADR